MRQFIFAHATLLVVILIGAPAKCSEEPGEALRYPSSSNESARVLAMRSDHLRRQGHYDEAIELGRLAIERDRDEMEAYCAYAEAMQSKLEKQGKPYDEPLLVECIRTWLHVMHGRAGEEKGMEVRGIGFSRLYEDNFRGLLARRSLQILVGCAPRPWETDDRFIRRALKPSKNVRGAIVGASGRTTK